MGKKSKNNEVYKIEIEIDNLTKEQYESIWAQLVDISGHSGKEITMKGGLEEPSDESSGLHKHGVNVRFNSELRDKFFKECTDPSPDSGRNAGIRPINLTAHDLFEWFKRNAR